MADLTGLSSVAELANKLIDRWFPSQEEKDKATLDLLKMQQAGELTELTERMKAIVTEASSADPWTSRARPSFLYVMYIMITFSIPMGVLSAFKPDMATAIAHGMQAWLAAIPDSLYTLFGVGYTGYAVTRTIDKKNGSK
jgi:ABC-type amino acid transport substrate-binding protein